ncbi:MAG TPA: ATP-binding protein [Candidatus Limnocylindrales bacterium]|nr:ATP-binding protein [Candidatus Limnocylindrales bacterium]
MKDELADLSRQYQVALGKHLQRGPRADLEPAQGLGRKAMTLGLGTLDLVRIHERTLIKLVLPGDSPAAREETIRRAGSFFAEAITPIEKVHRTARETNARLHQLNQMLRQQSADLAASNQQLKEEIARRKSAEAALGKSEQHYRELLEQSRHMQEQLRLLSRELLLAQEEERKKISRELHDVIAQTLTSINVRLAKLKDGATSNTRGLERNIARTQKLVEQSVQIVHRFARELRPTVLDDLGLIPALHTFLKSFRAETGIQVRFLASKAVEQVNGDKRTVLFRVAQEALTNVARHAQASQAEVQIQKLDGAVCMTIEDNGKGFHKERVLRGKKGKRLGLLGMRERLEMVGGDLAVTFGQGKGTTVIARVPLIDRASKGGEAALITATRIKI